jgi:hypothetical protein
MDSNTKAVFLALPSVPTMSGEFEEWVGNATRRIVYLKVTRNAGLHDESNEVHFAGLEKSKRELEALVDAMLRKAGTNLPQK